MSAELLKALAKVDLLHVPYKGAGPAAQDLLGGQVQLLFDTVFSQMGNVRAGKLKTYGITSAQRSPLMPEVPALAETLPGFEIDTWWGLVVPAATPRAEVQKLHAAFAGALAAPEVKARFAQLMAEPVGGTPEQFAALMQREYKRYETVVKASGAKAE
jgi:tripartite-type tricarboxylate transporter receptor subunit TctC